MQIRTKIQLTPPGTVYTKLFRQPYQQNKIGLQDLEVHLCDYRRRRPERVIRLTETISVHFFGISETGKENGPSKITEKSKSQMGTKRAKKALLEVIPPRICVTFRRGSFWFGPETSKMRIWKPRPENTTNTVSGSRPDFSEKSENHENRSELDPYWTFRAENQAF